MLGSHDSYTYLNANSSVVNLVNKYWRTQNKSITDQYNFGVRFFDIRVIRIIDKDGSNRWRTCHGLAEFPKVFSSIKSICVYFSKTLKGCKYRIWLEKGSDEDWNCFKEEALALENEFDGFVQANRKWDDTPLFQKDTYPNMLDFTLTDWSAKTIITTLFKKPIKDYAKKMNPTITQEMIDDPNTVYFMDYVCGFD